MRKLKLTLLVTVAFGRVTLGQPAPAPVRAADPRVDSILTALQKRSDDLRDIRCEVRLVEQDQINLSTKAKYGKLLFLVSEPNPLFLIRFDKTEVDGVVNKREWYLFDGHWLHQAVERIAQVTKQELALPGEKLDFFDLERTPFPVPFGQKKDQILSNFDVGLVPAARGDPPDCDHLVCKPKSGSRLARRYERLDLFIHRAVHLPSRIVVTKNDGLEVNTADFPDLSQKSINTGVKHADFSRPSEWKSYKEVVEKMIPQEKNGAP